MLFGEKNGNEIPMILKVIASLFLSKKAILIWWEGM